MALNIQKDWNDAKGAVFAANADADKGNGPGVDKESTPEPQFT